MKAVILAGGLGTRLAEETSIRPKPMVEIGGKPILWHIMKMYASHGIHDFVVCLGYKGYVIKEYFANYHLHTADVTFDLAANAMEVHTSSAEPWRVTLTDTGDATMTGGRIKRAAGFLDPDEAFCLTYGDGVADVDLTALIAHHRAHGRLATVTTVQPPGRYGSIEFGPGDAVKAFHEKPRGDGGWINGGFFVLEPKAIDYIDDDATVWEREPIERLAADDQLRAYRHRGYWHAMDTLRDRQQLEALWATGAPPWKTWA
ncbi:Glucose-1-phosphate cytidylyltransferase [Baekduia alba]|uniref:glucose-1-phosphate cytidylyltransferase n=1 Tax=Baekduia alba TaxID=2997333 RepID=UPI0023409100|nr:glucose-1-phosphate cytidylyltransferase [Baekduia alba]WCB96560.1 Glucose-1-phosphate cytidylyltransferase [Baekduia alba]